MINTTNLSVKADQVQHFARSVSGGYWDTESLQ
jgi:hypothetical protein